jgi:hypothetical protein
MYREENLIAERARQEPGFGHRVLLPQARLRRGRGCALRTEALGDASAAGRSGLSISLNLAESEGDLALVGKQAGSQPLFAIVTDDCLREYRRMKEAGVIFHGEPQVQPYGTGVLLEDLYGNKIYLNQEPG